MTAQTWLDVKPRDVDPDAPDQPLTLFAAPDAVGTLDLFDTPED